MERNLNSLQRPDIDDKLFYHALILCQSKSRVQDLILKRASKQVGKTELNFKQERIILR